MQRPQHVRRRPRAFLIAGLGALLAIGCEPAGAATRHDERSAPVAAVDSPPRLPGSVDVGHTLGHEDAPIAVVEFSDFGCPYCGRFALSTLPVIEREYIESGRVRWRYVPVTLGFPGGELMGAAAECAADQRGAEAFWAVHHLLYQRQVALRGPDARARLLPWLEELGLDRTEMATCIDDPATLQRLQEHTRIARDWFVRATPTFVINGVPMAGALPVDFFRKVFATLEDPSNL